jgi:hypothetical protein
MYEPHPIFDSPPAESKLWRYMDLTKLVALLGTKTLFFTRADRLGDPWEGATTRFNVKAGPKVYQQLPEAMRRSMSEQMSEVKRRLRLETWVHCWHMNQAESPAMWKLYVKSDAGIAIQTTFERLKDSMAGDKEHRVYIGRVRYIDYDTEWMPEDNSFWPFLHKRASFAYENEVRAVMQDVGAAAPQADASPHGVLVPVDIDRLIENVFIAPTTPEWTTQVIHSVLTRFGLTIVPRQSSLDDDPVF